MKKKNALEGAGRGITPTFIGRQDGANRAKGFTLQHG
jgi:hypothetical protein